MLLAQQFAEEFSGQVAGMPAAPMAPLLEDRQSQSIVLAPSVGVPTYEAGRMPQSLDEWLDFVQARVAKANKWEASGPGLYSE